MKFFITKIVFFCFIGLGFNTLNAQNPNSVSYQFLSDALIVNENLNAFLLPQISTISYENGSLALSQRNAKKIFADVASISNLYQQNNAFKDVVFIEILVRNQNDNNFSLQLSQLQSFTQLEYVLVTYAYDICSNNQVNCIENNLRSKIVGDSSLTVLYRLDLPR
ncbi:MAG TPA: hypothetical protein GXZ40_02175 [Bacteroidales bacterium]|jgi:hypothetical protein|nr:hypothetical protein [Bacteroidales bacterium]